jgi:hypothetical protein
MSQPGKCPPISSPCMNCVCVERTSSFRRKPFPRLPGINRLLQCCVSLHSCLLMPQSVGAAAVDTFRPQLSLPVQKQLLCLPYANLNHQHNYSHHCTNSQLPMSASFLVICQQIRPVRRRGSAVN